jgi:hypothetical protein
VTTVYYSLLPDGAGVYPQRWIRSATSLRRHNDVVPVVVCVYGAVPAAVAQVAAKLGVEVIESGEYQRLFSEVPPRWHAALGANPTLHKLASLRALAQDGRPGPFLYLDCDTHLAGDVAALGAIEPGLDFMAREEPGTRRSHHGYNRDWIDEDQLAEVAAREGLVFVPPYNCGVFRVSQPLAGLLGGLFDDFLWYVWRLLVGAVARGPGELSDTTWLAPVEAVLLDADHPSALRYPAGTLWMVEPLATWLLLGRVPDLAHGTFAPAEVAQSDEYRSLAPPSIVTHYFSVHETAFYDHLARAS